MSVTKLTILPLCFPAAWDGDKGGYDKNIRPIVEVMGIKDLTTLCSIGPLAMMVLDLQQVLPEFSEAMTLLNKDGTGLSLREIAESLGNMYGDPFRRQEQRVTFNGRKRFWVLFEAQLKELGYGQVSDDAKKEVETLMKKMESRH